MNNPVLDIQDYAQKQRIVNVKLFLAFEFCRFCVVIRFFIPVTMANDFDFEGFSIPDFILYIYFPILIILEKEPVFPFLMFSAKQGNYWYHFYNVFGMTWSLTGN